MDRTPPSSSVSQPLSLPKVCLVLPVSDVVDDFQCNMYIIDLNYTESVRHTVQLIRKIHISGEFFRNAAICVVGWTVFAFTGHSDSDETSKSIYKYVLDPNDECETLAKTSFTRCGSMKSIKLFPYTILVPYGNKIVVFSTNIHPFPPNKCDFELFDINNEKCIKLPPFPLGNYTNLMYASRSIEYYSFINDSVLLVQSTGGLHVINLGKYLLNDQTFEEPTWRQYCFPVPGVTMRSSFQHIGEEGDFGEDICLTPFGAFDFGIGKSRCNWYYTYPNSSFTSDQRGIYHIIPLNMTTDPSHSAFCTFCVRMKVDESDQFWTPVVMIDVYECNVRICKREFVTGRQYKRDSDSKFLSLPATVQINSLKICLDMQPSNFIYVRHSSVIPSYVSSSSLPSGRRCQSV